MNLDDFSTVVDDRRYINPQVALDESNTFIQNLRDTQQSRNAEIARDTHNLGTDVTSNLGGLSGSGSYFNARYQTPQTNNLVADLKATAQAQAMTDVLNNEIAQAKERYSKAYKAYNKRKSGGGGNPTTNPDANKKLPVSTNSGKDSTKIPGKASDTVEGSTWAGTPYKSNIYRYKYKTGLELKYDANSPYKSTFTSSLTAGKDGATRKFGDKTYIAINGQWYPVVK